MWIVSGPKNSESRNRRVRSFEKVRKESRVVVQIGMHALWWENKGRNFGRASTCYFPRQSI